MFILNFKVFLSILLALVIGSSTSYAQTEVTVVAGGGGDGPYQSGNIDGVGTAVALSAPRVLVKTNDNQLIIGDNNGLKMMNPLTNSVTTLWAYDNVYWVDVEIDSSGNIYATGGFWVDDPRACNDTAYTFRDTRIYKFSSDGTVLQTWGNECTGQTEYFTYGQYGDYIKLAIDSEDNVYAASTYTANRSGENVVADDYTDIQLLNNDGSATLFYDLQTIESGIDAIAEIDYNNGYLYIAVRQSENYQSIYRFNIATKALEFYLKIYDFTSDTAGEMIFENNELAYFSTSNGLRKVFRHNDELHYAYITGLDHGADAREPSYTPYDTVVSSGFIDALNLKNPAIWNIAKIDDEIYFVTGDYNRVLKTRLLSNEAPLVSMFDFPEEVVKSYNLFKFNASDSDGFISQLFCDFDDGNGEQRIYNSQTNGYYSSDIRKSVTYSQDGSYDISCKVYDNEGDSRSYTKSFTIGEPVEEVIVPESNISYDDFNTSFCGTYQVTDLGLQVNGSAYRYGNRLLSKKLYDVQDSTTKIKWKANSSSYSGFTPYIVGIISGAMTTSHSFAGSTTIDSDVWYYTTITIDGTEATITTAKDNYSSDGGTIVETKTSTLNNNQINLSKNGVQIGFIMSDTYASTNAYFVVSSFETTANEITKNIQKEIDFSSNEISDIFSDFQGNWELGENYLQITNGELGNFVTLDVTQATGIKFKANSKQTQSNFIIEAIDKDGNVITGTNIDPSTSDCFHEYYLPLTSDVVKVKFSFDKKWSIETYESDYKDVNIQELVVYGTILEDDIVETATCDFTFDNWEQRDINYLEGAALIKGDEYYQLNGAIWNNGCDRLKEGCDGNGLITKTSCNMLGKVIKTQFRVHSDNYGAFWIKPEGLSHYTYYNTHHSWKGGKVIPSDTDLYQTLIINDDGSWTMKLTLESFDGEVLHEQTGQASPEEIKKLSNDKFYLTFGDNYSGQDSYMYIDTIFYENINGSDEGMSVIENLDDIEEAEPRKPEDIFVAQDLTPPEVVIDTGVSIVKPDDLGLKEEDSRVEILSDDGDSDKKVILDIEPQSTIYENKDGGITSLINIDDYKDVMVNININGTFEALLSYFEEGKNELTKLYFGMLGVDTTVNDEGITTIKVPTIISPNELNIDLQTITDLDGKVTPKYTIDGKLRTLPAFPKGSIITINEEENKLSIEVELTLKESIIFN